MTAIGEPLARVDGRAKVTGAATYTADRRVDGMLHAALVTSPIACGRIERIDAAAALAVDGVTHVLTHADLPVLAAAPSPPLASSFMPMQGDAIRYEGQPVAIVLATTLAGAVEGARAVRVAYVEAPASVPAEAPRLDTAEPPSRSPGYLYGEIAFAIGPADEAAGMRHDAAYRQSSRHANPIETSATLAVWEGDRLTCYDTVQHGFFAQLALGIAFGIAPDDVRIVCDVTGGGFGVKGYVWPHQLLTAAAARVAGRPVKLVLSRAQFYTGVGYQPAMTQAVALVAGDDGRLASLRHDVVNATSLSDDYAEFATFASKGLYAVPRLRGTQAIERHAIVTPSAVRTPMDGPGTWAIESAMDELAHALAIDPLDLRLVNHADVDPARGLPWSSKKLREAYALGADAFGWRQRRRGGRDGHWLIGSGMATCTMGTFRFPSRARLRLRADGGVRLEASFNDVGQGLTTIAAQIAADRLGIDAATIEVCRGDTVLPLAGPTAGSSATISVGSSVLDAADAVRRELARLGNLPADEIVLTEGRVDRVGSGLPGPTIGKVMRAAGGNEVVGEGAFALPGDAPFEAEGGATGYAMRTFGAIFVEVGVDPDLGMLRLRRAVGSYSAGRIINPRTARSQMIGGIVAGWGQAVLEESRHDAALGRLLARNLSDVTLPVNADIPEAIDILFVDEVDPHASPLGAKGIGELAMTGVAAAVANAVFDATGKRLRELPITPARLLAALG